MPELQKDDSLGQIKQTKSIQITLDQGATGQGFFGDTRYGAMRQTGEGLTAKHNKSNNIAKVIPMEFDDSNVIEQSLDNLLATNSRDFLPIKAPITVAS